MSPAEKLALVDDLTRAVYELAAVGIRLTRPDATDDDVRIEIARRRYGEDVVRAALAARARRK